MRPPLFFVLTKKSRRRSGGKETAWFPTCARRAQVGGCGRRQARFVQTWQVSSRRTVSDSQINAYAAYWDVGYRTGDENELALLRFPLPLCFRKIPRSGSGKRSGNQFRFAPRMSPGVSSRADHFGFPQTRARAQPEAQTANIRRFLAKTPVFARTCRQAGFGHQSVFLLDRRSVKQTCLWHVCSVDLPSYAGQGNPGRGACLKENGGCIPLPQRGYPPPLCRGI